MDFRCVPGDAHDHTSTMRLTGLSSSQELDRTVWLHSREEIKWALLKPLAMHVDILHQALDYMLQDPLSANCKLDNVNTQQLDSSCCMPVQALERLLNSLYHVRI